MKLPTEEDSHEIGENLAELEEHVRQELAGAFVSGPSVNRIILFMRLAYMKGAATAVKALTAKGWGPKS